MNCMVSNCPGKKTGSVKMFQFPLNAIDEWCSNLRIDRSTLKFTSKVCSRHFTDDCYSSTKLRFGAMPTLNLGHDGQIDHYSSIPPKSKKIWRRKCCVYGCSSRNPPTSFFAFREEWSYICTLKEGSGLHKQFICARHFNPKFIKNRQPIPDPQYYLHGNSDEDIIPPSDDEDDKRKVRSEIRKSKTKDKVSRSQRKLPIIIIPSKRVKVERRHSDAECNILIKEEEI